jgi:hypothetical protein
MKYEDLNDWKYRVTEGFSIPTKIFPEETIRSNFATLTVRGRLYIQKGFCWDGASGAFDTDTIMKPSCCHDVGCNWFLAGLITAEMRGEFDDLFYALCLKAGMNSMRAKVVYKAVRANTRIRYGV